MEFLAVIFISVVVCPTIILTGVEQRKENNYSTYIFCLQLEVSLPARMYVQTYLST
jgi:hypothetical protein